MSFDAFPVYEADQVLTADSLNDMRDYLEHENRLTRRALIGIGVMCGFEVDVDADAHVHISKGVAVTSEGYLFAEDAVLCDRFRDYQVPLPTGDDVTPAQVDDAQYPFLFPDGDTQIEAWELLTTDVEIADGEPDPEDLDGSFLSGKTVMLFLEVTLESLRNCDINDCSDRGSELQFALRRLLIRQADADAIMASEQAIAGHPTDPANHPHLLLPFLQVPDLGIARHNIGTFPALFARIFQIAIQLADHLPQALRDAWATWRHLLIDMFPEEQFPGPNGPLTDNFFDNLWANLIVEPFQVQYFYDYMLDAVMAYNEFVGAGRAFSCACLPNSERFPRHVLLGDAVARPIGSGLTIGSPAEFAAFNPLAASTGLGPHPRPQRRRTPWTAACQGSALADLRWSFYRLILLGQAFQLRGQLTEQIRITPSRHDTATLGDRCIGLYYDINLNSDLLRVWSPRKTRANLLSTVHHRNFSPHDITHPLLYRGTDGETHYEISGHLGKGLDQVMAELVAHKQVLGLDFAIHPLVLGFGVANNTESLSLDKFAAQRAMVVLRRLILCRMGDFEVILLGLFGALFALLVLIIRTIGQQSTTNFIASDTLAATAAGGGRLLRGGAADDAAGPALRGAENGLASREIERLMSMARIESIRRPDGINFTAIRLNPEEREVVKVETSDLLGLFRDSKIEPKTVISKLAPAAQEASLGTLYADILDDPGEDSLFEKVRRRVATLELDDQVDVEAANQRVFNAVAATQAGIALMDATSISSIDTFDPQDFDRRMTVFADRLNAYAATAPVDPEIAGEEAAAANMAVGDYAVAIDTQRAALGQNGFIGEFQRRMVKIFEDLTLQGHARHNPGLEHRAGVSRGHTFHPLCIYRGDLLRQIELATPALNSLGNAFTATVTAPLASGFAAASAALLAAAGPARENALSELIVVGDLTSFHQCCDGDCSDLVAAKQIPPNYFDLSGAPSIARNPIMPNGTPPQPGPNIPSASGTLSALLWDIGVAPTPAFSPQDTVLSARQPPTTDTGEPGRLIGSIRMAGADGITPSVRIINAHGTTRELAAQGQRFEALLPPGLYRVVPLAEGFIGAAQTVTITTEQDTEIRLVLQLER